MNRQDYHKNKRAEAGQSLLEFAIMMIILLIILGGVLDLGRAYFAYVALEDAVGEGALYASLNPTCINSSSGAGCADPNNIRWRTLNESPAGVVISTSMEVQVICPDHTPGQLVTVTATYSHTLWTPVIGSIVGSNRLPLRAQASQTIQ